MTEPVKPESPPRRLLGGAFAVLAAIWIFLEEWVWDAMLALMARLGRLPPIKWLEAKVANLHPYAALVTFVVPGAIMLPFKLAAFWLIAHGHGIYGLWVFVVAKVVGTAFLARIFALTKPALMTIGWFARFYGAVMRWKERVYSFVRSMPAYQRMSALLKDAALRVKAWTAAATLRVKGWWRTRFGPGSP